jgi:lipopolysaccharide transport system permease protein
LKCSAWGVIHMSQSFFKELWNYRELFYFMLWRDIKVKYKQTVLGAAWAVIQPFFTMVVFTIFFGKLAKMPSDGIPYPVFSYCALLPWTYFSGALSQASNSIVANKNLVTKVYFPRIIIPSSSALSGLVDFSIASVILLGMMAYYKIQPSFELLLWPVLMIPLVMLVVGVTTFLASLNVRYRDIKHTIPFIVQLWLFLTPVIYPTSIIPKHLQILISLNPMVGIIEAFRATLLPDRNVEWRLLCLSIALSVLIFILGLAYFKTAEKEFADIL